MRDQQITGRHCTVSFPIDGDSQESEFQNATLQSTGDPGDTVEFSVATYVEVDPRRLAGPTGASAVERVAVALHELLEWLGSAAASSDGPLTGVSFAVQVGPYGDGEDAVNVAAEPLHRRSFTVSVPEDHRATIAVVERLGDRPGVEVAEEDPAPGPGPDTGSRPPSEA